MAGNSAAVAEMEEIVALMRDSGLTVQAASGWKDRGVSSSVNYWAVLCHHTAAENDNDGILINGRSDLSGPLCNWALHEHGDWVTIASGRANHAGEGTLPSSESYGVEATGPQDYPSKYGPSAFPNNYDSYVVGVACMLAVMGGNTGDVFGHKETATPPGRKIDPYFDMGPYRTDVKEAVPGQEEDLPLNDDDKNWIRSVIESELEEFRGRRPKNLSSDPNNKPLTQGESHGAYAGGIPKIQRQVEEILNMLKS